MQVAHAAPATTLVIFLAACAPAETPADTTADREAINALAEQEMQTLNAGDIEAHLATHTADAVVMPPEMPEARGHEAIRAVLEQLHGQFDVEGTYTAKQTTVVGDIAYQQLAFDMTLTPKGEGEPISDVGKGLHVLRRQPDGSWKIVVDIWNASTAPPGM